MLHWWTSGGEAAALNVLKQDLAKEGYAWKDVPVAGGGGGAAMTDAEGDGRRRQSADRLADPRLLSRSTTPRPASSATSRRWRRREAGTRSFRPRCRSSPPSTASGAPFRSTSIPSTGSGSTRRVMDKIGGTEPKTFDELIALLDKAKAAGVIPLALGGQPWQEATMFDSVVASTGGIDFYKKAFIDLDESALKSDTMKKAFDNLAKLRDYVDPNYAGRDWNLATAMVIKGDALVQVMGDWAKGEFKTANKEAGKDYPLLPLPGHGRRRCSTTPTCSPCSRFRPTGRRRRLALADATMSPSVQSASTSSRARSRRAWTFRTPNSTRAARRASPTSRRPTPRARSSARWRRTTRSRRRSPTAYYDVVTKFFHGEIKTSDDAVKQLVMAINGAK